jgi:menaquinone-dependent protoporphyrinogen IX oxidase
MSIKMIWKSAMAIVMMIGSVGCTAANSTSTKPEKDMKSIIVYFTYTANTELTANKLAEVTGSKVVRTLPAEPYSVADVDWTNEKSRCTQEHLNQTLRLAIQPLDIDFSQYDTVFIGFPIWWHEEPAVIRTFLDNIDLTGKQLYPFCTSIEIRCQKPMPTCKKAIQTSIGTPDCVSPPLPTKSNSGSTNNPKWDQTLRQEINVNLRRLSPDF